MRDLENRGGAKKKIKRKENAGMDDFVDGAVTDNEHSGKILDLEKDGKNTDISVADEHAARIDDAIKKAMDSNMIEAPYLGQDGEKNRKKRERPIVIPNLEDV